MFKVVNKRYLANNIWLVDVEAPNVAKACLPGQFVIVRLDEKAERVPLTICDYDREKNTITLVYQAVGASTMRMRDADENGYHDVVGPLGQPSELCTMPREELAKEKILFMAGGVGTAPVYPQVKWLKENGYEADVIIGARTKDLIILEEEMKQWAANLYIATDDGSYGIKGNVSVVIKEFDTEFDAIYSCGAPGMMKYINQTFHDHPRAYLSLESRMACGMGACYACVLKVPDSETVSQRVCEDGPVFKTGTVVL